MGIRCSDWALRMASIKKMAPVFFAFDRPIYQRLVCNHIADVLCYPSTLINQLSEGAFTVHFTPRANHAVGPDEAHEMAINKHAKQAIVKPEPELMQRISQTLTFQSANMENLKGQLGITSNIMEDIKGKSIIESNINKMIELIQTKKLLSDNAEHLVNNLNNTVATATQQHDLLHFGEIGQNEFENYIAYRILNKPSTTTKYRKKRLQTFTISNTSKTKSKQINRENKIIETCLKKQAVYYNTKPNPTYDVGPPFIALPRALCDKDGLPHKGTKSSVIYKFLCKKI
jgi:hypothetical protein